MSLYLTDFWILWGRTHKHATRFMSSVSSFPYSKGLKFFFTQRFVPVRGKNMKVFPLSSKMARKQTHLFHLNANLTCFLDQSSGWMTRACSTVGAWRLHIFTITHLQVWVVSTIKIKIKNLVVGHIFYLKLTTVMNTNKKLLNK